MKLSTRGRYGIHAMYDLAQAWRASRGPQPLKAIAQRQRLSEPYLEQLLGALRKGGLVRTVRGAQGGYMLSRAPEEITVGQVLRTLEGDLAFVECLEGEEACDKSARCPMRLVWQKVHEGVNRIVDSITLEDMLKDYARLSAEGEKTDDTHLHG